MANTDTHTQVLERSCKYVLVARGASHTVQCTPSQHNKCCTYCSLHVLRTHNSVAEDNHEHSTCSSPGGAMPREGQPACRCSTQTHTTHITPSSHTTLQWGGCECSSHVTTYAHPYPKGSQKCYTVLNISLDY